MKTLAKILAFALAGAAILPAAPAMAAQGTGGDIGYQGTIATLANDAGGKIYFTGKVCPTNPRQFAMFARSPEGVTITGCWIGDGESLAIVHYDNGNLYTYPMDEWVLTDGFTKFFNKAGTKQ